jgi:hypothetical protein
MFLKYSIEQIKIVIEKIEEFKAITEEEKLEKDGELSRKIEIENLQKSFEELKFEIKWLEKGGELSRKIEIENLQKSFEELKFEIKWLEKVGELSRKIELENLQKSFEELKFEIKWSNSVYDFHAIKRCTRAVSLIREPSRDMGNMKFQPAQIGNVQRFLKFVEDFESIEKDCECYTCKNHTKAYLAHLFRGKEILASTLATIHNVHFVVKLVEKMREAILYDSFEEYKKEFLEKYKK